MIECFQFFTVFAPRAAAEQPDALTVRFQRGPVTEKGRKPPIGGRSLFGQKLTFRILEPAMHRAKVWGLGASPFAEFAPTLR